jgi:hypothetical protein
MVITTDDPPQACTYGRVGRNLPGIPGDSFQEEGTSMYQAPKLERLGTFREVTLAGGAVLQADASNPFHRYDVVS